MFLKKTIVFTISFFIFSGLFAQEYNLRGRVAGVQPNTNDTLALSGATVSLYIKGEAKKWINLGTTITNNDGIYFFEKIKPGIYFIQVNKKKNFKIEVAEKSKENIQDLPLIIF